ncbi:hypothetical protein PQ610_03115 [Tardisphaera miroshnichenkoae]
MVKQDRALYAVLSLILVSTVFTFVLADVVFTYNGTVSTFVLQQPIAFAPGPNGNQPGYVSVNIVPGSDNTAFSVSVAITNAASIYYYQVLQLTTSNSGYVYVSSVGLSGSSNTAISAMTLYFSTPSGSPAGSITVISGGSPSAPSSAISLSANSVYYVSILITPTLPVTSISVETVSLTFGYNVINANNIVVP